MKLLRPTSLVCKKNNRTRVIICSRYAIHDMKFTDTLGVISKLNRVCLILLGKSLQEKCKAGEIAARKVAYNFSIQLLGLYGLKPDCV